MRAVLRIRQLAVQQTWCRPASRSTTRRQAASISLQTEVVEQPLPPTEAASYESVAGPSRLPSAPSSSSAESSISPSYFTPQTSIFFRYASPTDSTTSSEDEALLAQLEAHLAFVEDDTYIPTPSFDYSDKTYRMYYRLSPHTRRSLSRDTYRQLLRAIAPREWINRAGLAGFERIEKTGDRYERRLRMVIADMRTATGELDWEDYEVALARLARMGHVRGTESIYKEMVNTFSDAAELEVNKRRLIDLRSYAVGEWLKEAARLPTAASLNRTRKGWKERLTRDTVAEEKGEKIISALWSILHEYTSGTVVPHGQGVSWMTHSLNLARDLFPKATFAESLDGMLEQLFKQVYGIQLPYLTTDNPLSDSTRRKLGWAATNALAEWMGRSGDRWKMIAASEIFGEAEQPLKDWRTARNQFNKGVRHIVREANASATPVISPSTDARGDIAQESSSLAASGSAKPAAFRYPVAWYPSPTPKLVSIAHHASVVPLRDIPYAPKYHYGTARNVTFEKISEQTVQAKDLVATKHVFRAYVAVAWSHQADWVYSVLTQARLEKLRPAPDSPEWERIEREKLDFKAAKQERAEENIRRAGLRKELQTREQNGEGINAQAEITAQDLYGLPPLTLPVFPAQRRRNWLDLLKRPPVWISANMFVDFHRAMRAAKESTGWSAGGTAFDYRDLAYAADLSLQRLRDEHTLLSGRPPIDRPVDIAAYRQLVRESPAQDEDAPFARYLSDPNWKAPRYSFDPVAYTYQVNKTINKLRVMLDTFLEQKNAKYHRNQRKLLSRQVRAASMPERVRRPVTDPLEGLYTSPTKVAGGNAYLEMLKERQDESVASDSVPEDDSETPAENTR